jgi:hypothetical protein
LPRCYLSLSAFSLSQAHADGIYDQEVLMYEGSRVETGARADSTLEKLSSFKPVMAADSF